MLTQHLMARAVGETVPHKLPTGVGDTIHREVFILTARRFGKQSVAREAAAVEAQGQILRRRRKRLASRDAEYARFLAVNPEGNNRNRGATPIGRISLKTNRKQRQNHSHATKPSY